MRRLLTLTQGVAAVSVLLVAVSLDVALVRQEPEVFEASGALTVVGGTVLAARKYIRLGHEKFLHSIRNIDGGHFPPTDEEKEEERQIGEDHRAYRISFLMLVAGAIVGAYGSELLALVGAGA